MNGLEHGRLCERQLSTPGKTGLPGFVKPASWTRMARFSVNLFDALDAHGYGRVKQRNDLEGRRLVVESFPTSAWRGLRLPALPGKARASADDVALAFSRLSALLPISVSRQPSHDELQALIGGLAGLPFRDYAGVLPTFYGSKPFLLEGIWREGFIINPVLAGASTG